VTTTVLVPDDYGIARLAELPGVRPLHYDGQDDAPGPVHLPEEQRSAEVLVAPILDAARPELISALPRLRLVQLLTAGYEAWKDVLPKGIALVTARGAHGGATAEWVLAALLAVQRDLPRFIRAGDHGAWDYHRTGTLLGARVLMIGAGDVAQQVVRRLEPFGATATMVGRTARAGVCGMDEVPGLLGEHDVVVLAIPLTQQTYRLADADFLARMPDGAVLINAARGPVVHMGALLAELQVGRLRAALDVTDPEPLPADHPLWRAPGVLITPHVGGSVTNAVERAYTVAAEQIAEFLAGRDPANLVHS